MEQFERAAETVAGEKCGQTLTRADERDQRCFWTAFNTGKTIACSEGPERKKRQR